MKINEFIKIVFAYIMEFTKNFSLEEKQDIIKELDINLSIIKNSMKENETPQESLLRIAKENLGMDISFNDEVPDSVACASSLTLLIKKLTPEFRHITGTWTLWDFLRKDNPWFKPVVGSPEAGDVIISPSGTGNNLIAGHCGIFLENNKIASNNSYTGQWDDQFTMELWIKRYRNKGGFPIYFYRKVA